MSRKTIIVLVVASVVVCAMIGVGTLALVKGQLRRFVSTKSDQRQAARDMRDYLGDAMKGGKLQRDKAFPDTPSGRMNKVLYAYMVGSQDLQPMLETEMAKIGWEWVMTPESLNDPKGPQECVRRAGLMKAVVEDVLRKSDALLATAVTDLRSIVSTSQEAAGAADALESQRDNPNSPLALARRTLVALKENVAAVEAYCRLVADNPGMVIFAADGTPTTTKRATDAFLLRHDKAAELCSITATKLQELDSRREKIATEAARQAMQGLDKMAGQ